MKKKVLHLPTIGWREWISLPDIGIDYIKAKVDTGARSSAIHAVGVREYDRDGVKWVRFTVHPMQRRANPAIEVHARVEEYRVVRSSNGKATKRPVIVTMMTLLGSTWPVELTLASRDEMGFRMLLGREAFRSRFLVDAGKSYYGGVPIHLRRKARRKSKPATTIESDTIETRNLSK